MQEYDLILRDGMIYDGSGNAPFRGDVAIQGDVIAAVGDIGEAHGKREINVNGLAIAPGFINMLSWSGESLIEDGRSQSEIRQGVTLEVMGEGTSMGPLSEAMKAAGMQTILGNDAFKYDIEWTTLGEYLEWLEKRGVSCNIASFVGSSTLRIHAMGYDNRAPTPEELTQMSDLARQAMQEGAVGMSAALIYPPAAYADIDEIIELASAVSEFDGLYISHIRGEGNTLLEAVGELIEIAQFGHARAEIYHLKAAGAENWHLMDEAIQKIEQARADGLPISADVYTYDFSGTGLAACIPPWAHEGGDEVLYARLRDPAQREAIKQELLTPSDEWENMFLQNGADKILLADFRTEALKPYSGKTLAEVAAARGTAPEDTLMDLLAEDESHIFTMYFCMSEDNLRKEIALPWVSFCSDAQSQAPEGAFLKWKPHPRAYGSFARVLGKYVRDEKIMTLEEAVRRLTSFPAANLKIERRGTLRENYFADVVVFDPAAVQDHATPENPHQYSTGMVHVFVNGAQVLENGEHTGEKPGRFVRGPGWQHQSFEVVYPPKLHPFLTLGGDYDGTYGEFAIGKEFIPDLIRMATDDRLLFFEESRPQTHAPMHAWRRIAQLGPVEAAEPLLKLLMGINLRAIQELPSVYAMIGMKAFPVLANYLTNQFNLSFARAEAMNCLLAIVERAPDRATGVAYLALEGLLMGQLEKYQQNIPFINGVLIVGLARMESESAIPLIVQVYNEVPDVAQVAGKFEDLMKRMGVEIEDGDEDDEDEVSDKVQPRLAAPRASSDAKKNKAKRKQAEKVKKLNRKEALEVKSRQDKAPFLERLLTVKNTPGVSFHMPGHKFDGALNPALAAFLGAEAIEADLSEMRPGVDYLHAAKAELLEAQQLAAEACGADRTYFLVNGSTVGNVAALLAVVQDGQKIIVPRASHRSVYGGLILSGAMPIYVPSLVHPEVGFPLAVPPEAVAKLLEVHHDAKAIQITSPNYYGALSDIAALTQLAHEHGIPILVDEAHGAHLPYHPDLPASAVRLGADLVVQSSHKTIGALTQAAMLHVNGGRVNVAQLERFLALLQSSSPSVLLLASLDATRQQMATEGKVLLDRVLQLAQDVRKRIREIPDLWCYGEEWVGTYGIFAYDPTKLVIRVVDTGLSGPEFAQYLADDHALHVEFSDVKHIICSITIADDAARIDQLIAALRRVCADHAKPVSHQTEIVSPPKLPELALSPRQANFAPSWAVKLVEAVGEICAEQVMPYPPGIPLLVPGEIIDAEMVEYMRFIRGQGVKIVGPEDLTLESIRIINT